MTNMTKRDIADIVLVLVGLGLIFSFLSAFLSLGGILSFKDNEFFNKSVAVPLHLLYLLALLAGSWLLLIKRKIILNLLFPSANKVTIALEGEALEIIKYTFWIKLFGIITCLASAIKFISRLVSAIPSRGEYIVGGFWWHQSGPELISAILAIIVIWKADWIAGIFNKIGSSNKLSRNDS